MNRIHFIEHNIKSQLKNKKKLKAFLLSLIKKENKYVNIISFVFVTDDFLLSLNQKFLAHDYYTDTISFTTSLKNEPLAGEIYISIERVIENAAKFHVEPQVELLRVIIHSTLHLCGYQDNTKATKSVMFYQQELYLREWFGFT